MNKKLHSLLKAEDPSAYKKLAASGMMLAHPVTIQGQSERPDTGTHFHTSIKVFDPKDHAHAIHSLAQHLPLNPPDAKNTQIEPGQFKDRFGNDVFVIKLKGNSADKMKEHNAKFAGFGTPTSYEFTPHISVPKALHDQIKASGAKTAHEAGISFGPAELKQGPKTLKTYHHKPDTDEPAVPDESDLTAKIKAPITKSENLCLLHKSELDNNDEDAHALLNRKEDKYFLPRRFIEQVISELSTRFALGDIDTDTRYCRNRTIYLDDKDLSAFRSVVSKTVPRTKVRIRQYSPNNQGWEQVSYAEFKIKEEDGQSKKIRVRIPAAYISELAEGGKIIFDENLVNINKDLDKRILEHRVIAINNAISQKGLHKQLEVQYERRAYSGKNLRITIDDDLNFLDSRSIDPTVKSNISNNEDWSKFLKPYLIAAWENPLILEVKSSGDVPNWLKKLLKDVEAKAVSFSKYAAAMVTHLRTSEKDGKVLSVAEESPGPMHKSEDLQDLAKGEKNKKFVDIAVVILRDGNFILVGKRNKNGKWGLPGGRSEKGEDNKEVATRELEEETGLKLKRDDLSLAGIREIEGTENKRIHIYTAKYPGGEPTTEDDPDEEFKKWRWIRCEDDQLPDEFLDARLNPPTKAAFKELEMVRSEAECATEPLKPLLKPWKSNSQRRWGHTPSGKKALGGNAGVHEWDEATKGKELPEKVSKKEEPLEKGALKNAALGLGMLGAAAGVSNTLGTQKQAQASIPKPGQEISSQAPATTPAPIQAPAPPAPVAPKVPSRSPASIKPMKPQAPAYDHNRMLRAIAQVESSGGINTKHGEGGGPIHGREHAYGTFGLMPETIREIINGHKDLKAKHGKALALKGKQLHRYMHDHPNLENIIADRHLSHMEHVLGNNPSLLGFSWLNGTTGGLEAKHGKVDYKNHWHAKRVKAAYDKAK